MIGRYISGFLEKVIQTPMAQGRSVKIISMIKWIRTSRLSMKNSFSLQVLDGEETEVRVVPAAIRMFVAREKPHQVTFYICMPIYVCMYVYIYIYVLCQSVFLLCVPAQSAPRTGHFRRNPTRFIDSQPVRRTGKRQRCGWCPRPSPHVRRAREAPPGHSPPKVSVYHI